MAVLKCTVCGGELEVNADLSVGVCKFCDSTIIIPKALDRKGNLYNRATFLRQNNEFDKAAAVYEDILKEDNDDAQAHWGLLLSRFGIEYVTDPNTQEKFPTCHRTQPEPILSDVDYLAALKYADAAARRVIEEEGKRLYDLQQRIIEISKNEPPYDIFICYKETDASGNRTEDSTLAQELYYELVKREYRVFFARKTLEGKLGAEYEPVIYAALHSARVMIVLGTRPEHFSAVWVRNEWSRFCKLAQSSQKVIIPAYRGMSPYELPAELAPFQAQDMGKIGFLQDLTDGVERCLRGEMQERKAQRAAEASSTASCARLLERAQTYLKLKDFSTAKEQYITLTKEYPEEYLGWWGLIVCETVDFSVPPPAENQFERWFGYAKQLSAPEDFLPLEKTYVEYYSRMAGQAADKEMDAVDVQISEYKSRIDVLQSEINHARQKIAEEDLQLREQTSGYQENIYHAKTTIEDCRHLLDVRKFKRIVCIVLLVLLVIGFLLAFGVWSDSPKEKQDGLYLFLFCFAILGILFSTRNLKGTKGRLTYQISDALKTVTENEQSVASAKADHAEKLQRINRDIEADTLRIKNYQKKIDDCTAYLALGKDKAAALWLARECAAAAREQSQDEQAAKLRAAVFSEEDVNAPDESAGEEQEPSDAE